MGQSVREVIKKTCNICKRLIEINLFYKRADSYKDNSYKNKYRSECKECSKKRNIGRIDYYKSYNNTHKKQRKETMIRLHIENPGKRLFRHARNRAKEKQWEFDLSSTDIVIPKVCPVLGIPIIVGTNGKRTHNSPSLDRIDTSKGYIKDNIIIVSWRVNDLKRESTKEEREKIYHFYKKYDS